MVSYLLGVTPKVYCVCDCEKALNVPFVNELTFNGFCIRNYRNAVLTKMGDIEWTTTSNTMLTNDLVYLYAKSGSVFTYDFKKQFVITLSTQEFGHYKRVQKKSGYFAEKIGERAIYLASDERHFKMLKKMKTREDKFCLVALDAETMPNIFGNNYIESTDFHNKNIMTLVNNHLADLTRNICLYDTILTPTGIKFICDVSKSYINRLNKSYGNVIRDFLGHSFIDTQLLAYSMHLDYADWVKDEKIVNFVDEFMTIKTCGDTF